MKYAAISVQMSSIF